MLSAGVKCLSVHLLRQWPSAATVSICCDSVMLHRLTVVLAVGFIHVLHVYSPARDRPVRIGGGFAYMNRSTEPEYMEAMNKLRLEYEAAVEKQRKEKLLAGQGFKHTEMPILVVVLCFRFDNISNNYFR